MAQLLAPYNSSMRLGQGFNSYTQQVCLDRAVARSDLHPVKPKTTTTTISKTATAVSLNSEQDPQSGVLQAQDASNGNDQSDLTVSLQNGSEVSKQDGGDPYGARQRDELYGTPTNDSNPIVVQPWVKPQIVTYSSRFVDKLSDVTESMNISGSLSIKTATIGGKANGSYIDSDKFKSSDINFHLQVKVTNQVHDQPIYDQFQKINSISPERFTEIYGDTFIAGWETGGELNAVISMKVHDKEKINQIKGELEVEFKNPSIGGEVAVKGEKLSKELAQSTETTIAVNWCGGGSIKDPGKDWNIATVKEAAAAFPELVAVTPQRVYAILQKYTSLSSFFEGDTKFSPLEYENAGIYTNSLLDYYMDYKSMWKQISSAIHELKNNRATSEMAAPSQAMADLATIEPLPLDQKDILLKKRKLDWKQNNGSLSETPGTPASSTDEDMKQLTEPMSPSSAAIKYPVFQPSFAGLIQAKRVCRVEMAKIVNEVDLVSHFPEVASDIRRDTYFLNPLVFEQLLPVVRSLSPEDSKAGVRDPAAAVMLGYVEPKPEALSRIPVHIPVFDSGKLDFRVEEALTQVQRKSRYYRIQGFAGNVTKIHSGAEIYNDLQYLDATYRPVCVSVWMRDNVLIGLRTEYSNGLKKDHGTTEGTATTELKLASDASEIIVEVALQQGKQSPSGTSVISSLSLVTSVCNVCTTDAEVIETPETSESGTSAADTSEKAKEKNASTSTSKGQITSLLRRSWTRPEDGQWSLRGFMSVVQNAQVTALGIIWGRDAFVPVPQTRISTPLCKSYLSFSSSLQRSVHRFKNVSKFAGIADSFFLGECCSTTSANPSETTAAQKTKLPNVMVFNALDDIDTDWKITGLGFTTKDKKLAGLRVIYKNGSILTHGEVAAPASDANEDSEETDEDDTDADLLEIWNPKVESDLVIAKITASVHEEVGFIDTVEFVSSTAGDGKTPVWPLDTNTLRYLGESGENLSEPVQTVIETGPKLSASGPAWTVRGFYGEVDESSKLITKLGIVWGQG